MKFAVRVLVIMTCLVAFGAVHAEDSKPLTIGEDERVLHVVGAPFDHIYCLPRLETLLLEHFSDRGLVYRRVEPGTLAQCVTQLDELFRLHRPTLVILQSANNDLLNQYRQKEFDFSEYPGQLAELVGKLRRRGVRVVICSAVPIGNGSTQVRLLPPNDGLRSWVNAAQATAARYDANFVDLFTTTVDWPMIGNLPEQRSQYAVTEHERSFELLRRQLGLPQISPSLFNSKPWQAELTNGHQMTRELQAIQGFRLPDWVKLPDFAAQRRGAMQKIVDDLTKHDQAVREMVAAHRQQAKPARR